MGEIQRLKLHIGRSFIREPFCCGLFVNPCIAVVSRLFDEYAKLYREYSAHSPITDVTILIERITSVVIPNGISSVPTKGNTQNAFYSHPHKTLYRILNMFP